MSLPRKEEERYLTAEERELVASSHLPALSDLEDAELARIRKLVRERRDRAGDIAKRQRREMRGKSRPKGGAPAADDSGSRMKISVLAQAMKRLNSETSRRERASARSELTSNARKALEMKKAAAKPARPKSKTADKGMKSTPNRKNEQITDPREVGRVSQAVKKGQAKRDR